EFCHYRPFQSYNGTHCPHQKFLEHQQNVFIICLSKSFSEK
ncbi:hypothetical protein Leryth_010785, partial [Lithospermum erythrorhizon]